MQAGALLLSDRCWEFGLRCLEGSGGEASNRANSQIITSINLIQANFQHWQFPISSLRAHALEVTDWCSPIKKLLWRQASYLQGV